MNKTKIEWSEMSWNPITGCDKISKGCEHCYAERMSKRLKAMGNIRYVNGFKVTIHEDLIEVPLNIKRSKIIFVNSMSDIFHKEIPDTIIVKIFEVMKKANWHIFQVLTKRPERLLDMDKKGLISWSDNIWIGVSVEDKENLKRADLLRQTNAKVKFLSCEPLLEELTELCLNNIDWVIVGGESGPKSRPLKEAWVQKILKKCEENEIPFFFKQWGGTRKKKNGRTLNGKIYNGMPFKNIENNTILGEEIKNNKIY